ncbi:MAG: calcium-binding protein, partial [Deltaproteobacteria bacterium]
NAHCKSKREISPLCVGEEVGVLGMAPEEECESEMFVRVRWGNRRLAVPLSQLEPTAADPATREAVGDWHYWVARGYQF